MTTTDTSHRSRNTLARRTLIAICMTAALAMCLPGASAGATDPLLGTVQGMLGDLRHGLAPSAEIETAPPQETRLDPYVVLLPAAADDGAGTAATPSIITETETSAWPFVVAIAAILLATLVFLLRGRKPDEPAAEREIAEVLPIRDRRKPQHVTDLAAGHDDILAVLERDIAEARGALRASTVAPSAAGEVPT